MHEYKPSAEELKASDSFFKEMSEAKCCNKSCEKPSLFKRLFNAGVFVRWYELLLVAAMGYLAHKHSEELITNAPTIVTVVLVIWFAKLLSRTR